MVMYAGRVVEEAPKTRALPRPQHPYTWGLLGSMPRVDQPRLRRLTAIPGRAAVASRTAGRLRLRATVPAPVRPLRDAARSCASASAAAEADACYLDPSVRPALRQATLRGEIRESA